MRQKSFFQKKKQVSKNQYSLSVRHKFLQNTKLNLFCKISIRRTANNVFVTLTKFSGKIIKNFTTGSVGFRNSRKDSYYAAESVGYFIQKFCLAKNLFFCSIVLQSPLDTYVRGVIKHLVAKDKIKLLNINQQIKVAHNGTRRKKLRRVL